MGRYSGASGVAVSDRHPMLDEEVSESVIEIVGTRDGSSKSNGLPYSAVEVRIIDSDVYRAGEVRTWMTKQRPQKGGVTYFLRDVKKFVGAAYDLADKSDCSEEQLEEFFSDECPKIGAILQHRVYAKPPNNMGKVFNDSVTSFLASSIEAFEAQLADG